MAREQGARPHSCPLCGSSRIILTHETESVHLWRCQRCGLQWPTVETEPVGDTPARDKHDRDG